MKTLHLNLIRMWFDGVYRLIKKEEYRKISPYWCSRFLLWDGKNLTPKEWELSPYWTFYESELINIEGLERFIREGQITFKIFDFITFSNGYVKDRPQFEIEFKGFEIREGRTEWGAITGTKYFVLLLGKIIKQ